MRKKVLEYSGNRKSFCRLRGKPFPIGFMISVGESNSYVLVLFLKKTIQT